MARGLLQPLVRAAEARSANREPSPADLRACHANRYRGADNSSSPDLSCWNGKRPDRPNCNYVGSQNIPVYAETGLARWHFHVALANLWRDEGMFGMELGSPGNFYYRGVLGCMATAYRNLLYSDWNGAQSIRHAIRSAAAWDALTALPIYRLEDTVYYSDRTIKAVSFNTKKLRSLTVAVSGMRWSEKAGKRGELTSEDSHSEFLNDVLTDGSINGIAQAFTRDELWQLRQVVNGDALVAKTVASWMYGTINTPSKLWKWRLRRTTLGTESVFLGSYPNSMKPMRVATQLTNDGKWVGMSPTPEIVGGKQDGWASGFNVEIVNGVIKSSCAVGSAELRELDGDIIWQVDVEGANVTFHSYR